MRFDLTDEEWSILEPLIPGSLRSRRVDDRRIMNGIDPSCSVAAGKLQSDCVVLAKLSLSALVFSLLALTLSMLTNGRLEGPWAMGGLP